MNIAERNEYMKKLAEFHLSNVETRDLQIIKTVEELVSLSKELCKYVVNSELGVDIDYWDLYDEMFDVEFMMFQLKRLFLNNPYSQNQYDEISIAKIERELERWGLNDK